MRRRAPIPDPGCLKQNAGFAWNHGDDQPEIASTWQGWVGPDVQNLGVDASLWTDHPDARPTLLSLLGLSDDYTEDGRAIAQIMTPAATPARSRPTRPTTTRCRPPTSSSTRRSASSGATA